MLSAKDYQQLIKDNNKEIKQYQAEYRQALRNVRKAEANGGVFGGKTAKEWQAEANGYAKAIKDAERANVEYTNSIIQIPFEKIEKQLKYLDAQTAFLDSKRKLEKALGQDLKKSEYLKDIEFVSKEIDQYLKKSEDAQANYDEAIATGENVGEKSAKEWKEVWYDAQTNINNLNVEIQELKNALRDDVYWRAFERAHAAAQRLQNVLKGIDGLIDDSMLFDKDGELTKYGAAHIANLIKQYEIARDEVENYSNDIQNLNNLYAEGQYPNELEYLEKLSGLKSSLLDAASSVKSITDSITDMYKNMAQNELDMLYELIDARSEALNKKKEYYEYDKTIKEQTKDVMSLQAQIAALEGVAGAEAKAKRAQLQAQLSEAQTTLDETVRDHILELSQNSLDDMKNMLQETFDDKWENVNANLKEITELLSAATTLAETSSAATQATLTSLLHYYGINLSQTGLSSEVQGQFASGITKVPRRLRALVGENGDEIITTQSGLILTLNKGDGVIPANMTKNLMAMATGSVAMPAVDFKAGNTTINQHYDSLITIEGSADAATVEDLKKFSKDILEQSYNYTSQKIYDGYIKAGGKRVV